MHLYRRLHHRKINMMIPHYLIRTHLIHILHDFPAASKVYVYISGSTYIRVRIKQRIPLPLQDTVSKALVLEVLANFYGIQKQSDILFPYLFRHHHPLHQQLLLWCQLLWQLPDTIKQHTKQSLLLGDSIQLLPIHLLQRTRYFLGRTNAESQEIKENLLLFQNKVVFLLASNKPYASYYPT